MTKKIFQEYWLKDNMTKFEFLSNAINLSKKANVCTPKLLEDYYNDIYTKATSSTLILDKTKAAFALNRFDKKYVDACIWCLKYFGFEIKEFIYTNK